MNKRRVLGLIIIAIGIILISIPRLVTKNLNKSSESTVEYFNEIEPIKIEENTLKEIDEEHFDFNAVEEISPTNVFLDPSKIDQDLVIGQIVIPSIKVNLTIFKGVSNDTLAAGVGTMKPEQLMGEGNYAIAGHNAKGALFSRLNEVMEDDIIKITDKSKIYEYKVYGIEVVDPSSLYMIEDEESNKVGEPIISLMNCQYENGVNTGKRYFVLGKLENIYDYDSEEMNKVK